MTGDQWFTLGFAALCLIGVIGGILAGAYISRKAHHLKPHPDDAAYLSAGLAISLLIVVLLLVLCWAQYLTLRNDLFTLRGEVKAACSEQSVVARLDLSEWVKPCLTVKVDN